MPYYSTRGDACIRLGVMAVPQSEVVSPHVVREHPHPEQAYHLQYFTSLRDMFHVSCICHILPCIQRTEEDGRNFIMNIIILSFPYIIRMMNWTCSTHVGKLASVHIN
jgi:hypothetical protein